MNKNIFFTLVIGFIFMLFLANFALAQNTTNSAQNTSQNNSDVNKVSGNSGPNLKAQNPGEFLKNIYVFAMLIGGFLAFGAIVYGGIKRASARDNANQVKDSEEWIKNAIIGLILLFGAYILLNTINPNLLRLDLPELKEVKIETPPPNKINIDPNDVQYGDAYLIKLKDSDAKNILQKNGIGVKSDNTTLEGIRESTIAEVIRLKNECDAWMQKWYPNEYKGQNSCGIYITGGTEKTKIVNGKEEPAHGSNSPHYDGYKVDLRLTNRLNEFIEKTYCNNTGNGCISYGKRGDGAIKYKSPNGFEYAKEGDHWDITVKPSPFLPPKPAPGVPNPIGPGGPL
jgi:hypothetical protein